LRPVVAHDFPLVATARAGFAKEPAALRFAGGGNGRSATIATLRVDGVALRLCLPAEQALWGVVSVGGRA